MMSSSLVNDFVDGDGRMDDAWLDDFLLYNWLNGLIILVMRCLCKRCKM